MLAQRIAAALKPRGMKVRAAQALDVSPSAVTGWTRGAVPDWPLFAALMDWLHLDDAERDVWIAEWVAAQQGAGANRGPFVQGRWVFVPVAA